MPELPDVVLYLKALDARFRGKRLDEVRLRSPFLLRSVAPPLAAVHGRLVRGFRRIGKRIVWELEGELFLVFHLMIAGRFHLKRVGGMALLAELGVGGETLRLTEAGSRKRASLHVAEGEEALRAFDPGGLEVLEAGLDAFRAALARESHTLKRALTDPRLFSGIGNAYSDEILHRARLSPARRTAQLAGQEVARLHAAVRETLIEWMARLEAEAAGAFPEKVTAFREGMAVHGRYGKPCPTCGSSVQRIVYAENEANYCATCQTGGRLLADRALSRLLKEDWPRTLEELEEQKGVRTLLRGGKGS